MSLHNCIENSVLFEQKYGIHAWVTGHLVHTTSAPNSKIKETSAPIFLRNYHKTIKFIFNNYYLQVGILGLVKREANIRVDATLSCGSSRNSKVYSIPSFI